MKNGEITTYKASTDAATEAPPAPDHAPQFQSNPRILAKLRSANGARIILGATVALLLVIT